MRKQELKNIYLVSMFKRSKNKGRFSYTGNSISFINFPGKLPESGEEKIKEQHKHMVEIANNREPAKLEELIYNLTLLL